MGVSTKGIILMKEESKDIIEILDTIKNTCDEIFREQARKAFDLVYPEDKGSRRPIYASLPKEEKANFSHPEVLYSSGFFHANFAYRNDLGEKEARSISIFTDKKFGNDINNEFDDFNSAPRSGIILSFSQWGDSEKIMTRLLEKFGDTYPSFLIKSDCAGVDSPENLVKIGNAVEYDNPVKVSPLNNAIVDEAPKRKSIRP